MKKIIILSVIGLLGIAFSGQAKPVVSIGTFKNKTKASNRMFNSLIDRMTNGIVNTRKFTVVDNARLKEALNEQKKVEMGMSPEAGAPKSGKFKVAGYVLYGTVLNLGLSASSIQLHGVTGAKLTATVELNLRFMDAETGELIASKIVKATKVTRDLRSAPEVSKNNKAESAVQDAVQAAADKVVNSLMELAFPTVVLKVGARNVFVNLTEERARRGDLLRVFSVGESLTDPDTGESLGSSEELLGELKIIRTAPKFAVAAPVPPLTTARIKKGMRVRPISAEELATAAEKQQKEQAASFRKRF